ncbi:hypothetical protein DP117_32000 [Brasilonema sp. UFV-L1]|nr:hypothetical protein [Brasilonema sp. UFV-L1]
MAICVESDVYLAYKHYEQAEQALASAIACLEHRPCLPKRFPLGIFSQVDLECNDLRRVCEWGTVAGDELLIIEGYRHVMHLVSNIKGSLKSDCNAVGLIRAMLSGGIVIASLKVRYMETIDELEPMRRSLFYASCSYLDWQGNLDLNPLSLTFPLTCSTEEDEATRITKRNSLAFANLTTLHFRTDATSCASIALIFYFRAIH